MASPNSAKDCSEAVGDKQGIVTKAAGPGGSKSDATFASSIEEFRLQFKFVGVAHGRGVLGGDFGRGHKGQRAAEPGGAFRGRNVLEQMEELGVVFRVRRVAGFPGVQRGKARGINAGRAVERIHFEPQNHRLTRSLEWKFGRTGPEVAIQRASSAAFFVALPAKVEASSTTSGAPGKSRNVTNR